MGFLNRKETIEQRESQSEISGEGDLLRALENNSAITCEKALNIPSFCGCVEFISSTIAMLPIKLYEEKEGETQEVQGDKRVSLLNDETGDTLDSYCMKKALLLDYLINGNGYIYINRKLNSVKSLHYVDCSNISVSSNCEPIFKRNDFYVNGEQHRGFEFIKLLRNSKDGATGEGIVKTNEQVLSVAYNSLAFENKLVNNGGNKKGFIKSTKKLTEGAMEVLKTAWANLYSNNENNMMILNDGLDFRESSNSSVEMQLNENKETNSAEICKLFLLSPKLISGQASDDEFSTSVKTAILPIINALETALNKELLLENQKSSFYFAVDTSDLLKGDIKKRFEAYKLGLQSNFLQIDEVRYRENLKPLGFNYIKLGLNDVLLDPKTNIIYTPNTNATVKLGDLAVEPMKKTDAGGKANAN